MTRPILAELARDDLSEIWANIAEARDGRTANRMIRTLLSACDSKAELPETGRLREEIAPGPRGTVVRPYVIFFRPLDTSILVLRILHGHRDGEQSWPIRNEQSVRDFVQAALAQSALQPAFSGSFTGV